MEGGIYWECKSCSSEGVISKSDFADTMRQHVRVFAPEPLCVIFTSKDCPACGPDKLNKTNAMPQE